MAHIHHLSQKGDVAQEHRINVMQTKNREYFAQCGCGDYRGPKRLSNLAAKDDGAAHIGIEVSSSTSGMCATILRSVKRIPSTVSHAIGAGRLTLQLPPDVSRCSVVSCGATVDRDRAELSQIRANRILCIHHYQLFKKGKLP